MKLLDWDIMKEIDEALTDIQKGIEGDENMSSIS